MLLLSTWAQLTLTEIVLLKFHKGIVLLVLIGGQLYTLHILA